MRCALPTSPRPAPCCRSASGSPPAASARRSRPGTAARIFTGAQVPAGADAVVMQEQCSVVDGGVRVEAAVRRRASRSAAAARTSSAARASSRPGSGSRRRRSAWRRRSAPRRLQVARRPRVALFSTGDELAMPGEALKPGAIYNSNRFTLRGLIESLGGVHDDLGIVPDKLDATRAALKRAAEANDLIVTCGGVSVGEEDHLKPAVEKRGPPRPLADRDEARQAAGVRRGFRADGSSAWFIGLPGNPVSAFVTFLLAVRPVLLRAAGRERSRRRGRSRCAPTSPGPSPTAGASSCACAATTPAGSTCSATRARRC